MLRLGWKAPEPPDDRVVRGYVDAYAPRERWQAMLAYYRGVARPWLRRLLTTPGRDGGPPGRPPRVDVDRRLVVWGALDPALPLAVGQATAHDLGSGTVLVTVPGAGHFVVEEAPDVVVPVVAGFLRDGEVTSGGGGARRSGPRSAARRRQPGGQSERGAAGDQPLQREGDSERERAADCVEDEMVGRRDDHRDGQ